jgi:elongation factor P
MAGMNDLKLGTVIDLEGQPFQLVFSQHVKMGRGGAVLKTKLKNLITGNQLEKTFKGGDSIYLADLQHGKANYLYTDGEGVHFMNNESYDQFFLSPETVGDKKKYLKEGSDVDMLLFNDNPVAIELPKKVEFEVTSAPGSERGDTTQGGATKEVELENGSTIKTPLFIKTGDTVRINTDTGDYVERV